MKHSMPRLMSQAQKDILWDSFEELVKAIGGRDKTLQRVVDLFAACMTNNRSLRDDMKRNLIEALK